MNYSKKRSILLFFWLCTQIIFSQNSSKTNTNNYNIPDGVSTSNAGTAYSSVTFSGFPSNAKIIKVTIATRVQHEKHSDLAARVSTNWNGISSPSVVIYTAGSQGNNSGALEKSGTTSAFNDLNPNQTFYFRVWDTASENTGYIDAFSIRIEYTVPPTVTSVSPLSANTNEEVTFTIKGNYLTSGMGFHVDNLENIQELSGGSSTRRYFKGTFQQYSGTKNGVVKDVPNGTTLFNFSVNVSTPHPTVSSVSPLSANTNEEVTFTVTGENLTNNMQFFVEN